MHHLGEYLPGNEGKQHPSVITEVVVPPWISGRLGGPRSPGGIPHGPLLSGKPRLLAHPTFRSRSGVSPSNVAHELRSLFSCVLVSAG